MDGKYGIHRRRVRASYIHIYFIYARNLQSSCRANVFETIFNFIYSTQYLIVLPYDGDL